MSSVEVMIDLETLSVLPNAAILTIGAVKFTRAGPTQLLKETTSFYRRINLQSCIDVGLTVSEDTQKWWDRQSEAVRFEALECKERIGLVQCLNEFSLWFRTAKKIWSHGDDFDCVILASAYRACDLIPPWDYWNTRDTRTIFDLAEIRLPSLPNGQAHHALNDAYHQMVYTKQALRRLHRKKKSKRVQK